MTTTERIRPHREGDLDVPEWVPRGIDLGRVNNREKAIAMFGRDYVEELTDHALLGDDVAYRAMLEFKDKSNNTSWRTFDLALERGIDAVEEPTPALVELFASLDRIPEWVDFDQLYRGAVAFWRAGIIVPPVVAWSSIAGGFSLYSSTRPVLFSGRLGTVDRTGTRLIESFRYIVAAYTPGNMTRFGEGFRLTSKVRMIHAAVRYSLSRADTWDWANWGIPINNLDSMETQAGQFCHKIIDAIQNSGIRFSDREIEDIAALARYVGYVIGVPESILHKDYEDACRKSALHGLIEQPADEYCREVAHSVIRYSVENPPGDINILPAFIEKKLTTERRLALAYGMLYSWLPRETMDMLHVEPTRWRHVLPAVRPLISVGHRISRILPHDDEKAAFALLKQFNAAIAIPGGDRKHEVANPEEVGADIEANRGNMPKVVSSRS
ncbi:oxygenase MpaB family protein [Rhodococcus qingshengii]|uniref:oxygenase MpaB family protein n=1 Tax=Rhodococcus qingshengii TaxID=334542 RepID=UPI0036DEF8DC